MTDTCKKCGRPESVDSPTIGTCWMSGDLYCEIAAASYRRGLLRGVEIAKERIAAYVVDDFGTDGVEIDWSDVDEAAKRDVDDADS